MEKKCLKCGYERAVTDTAPDIECPKCGAIYAKVEAALKRAAGEEVKTSDNSKNDAVKEKAILVEPKKVIKNSAAAEAKSKTAAGANRNPNLTKCKTCGNDISKSAEACPHCGEPIKKQKPQSKVGMGCGTLIWLGIIYVIAMGVFSPSNTSTAPPAPKTPEQIRKDEISRNFSAWDGSHRKLTEMIKKQMNDPDSYEHVETVYWDKDDYLIVKTTFRGKNAFGGVVKNTVMAKVGLDGNVIEIISQ